MSEISSEGYDPTTLLQYLWWKERCATATPSEFQHLFERVAEKLRSDFVKVRPYGKLGDRKCDGLFWGEGTVFQVYSPDELKQRETMAKIDEDLGGAVREWGSQLKKWVFVYNTRRGIPPDIPRMLAEKRAEFQKIDIELLSDEALWNKMRNELSVQERAEVLGPITGLARMFIHPGTAPEDVEKQLEVGRIVLLHDVLSPIDVRDAIRAMAPDLPFGPPAFIGPKWPAETWSAAASLQESQIAGLLIRSRDMRPRFAVFSLAPIPLAVHLGQVLSDRVDVLPFQYDRARRTWVWDEICADIDDDIQVEGVPAEMVPGPAEAIVRFSLSASIDPSDTMAVVGDCAVQLDLSVANPDVNWLCRPAQLVALEIAFRNVLKQLSQRVPDCARIHLFFAGPTGGAIALGRVINPRMNPEVALYEYSRTETPRYKHVLTIGSRTQ